MFITEKFNISINFCNKIKCASVIRQPFEKIKGTFFFLYKLKFISLFILCNSPLLNIFAQSISWLPDQNSCLTQTLPIVEDLQLIGAKIRPIICLYEENRLKRSVHICMTKNKNEHKGIVEVDQTKWSCTIKKSELSPVDGLIQLCVKFSVLAGKLENSGVAIAIDFDEWSEKNNVLIPAAAYNGNRFKSLAIDYPPTIYHPDSVLVNPELTITDVPRLNIDMGQSKLELTSGDAATPAICVYNPEKKRGIIVLSEQTTRLGNYGIIIEESEDREQATLILSAPAVREYRAGGTRRVSSEDSGVGWSVGDELTMLIQFHVFPSQSLQELYDNFFKLRKSFSGPIRMRNLVPFSQVFEWEEEIQNNERWHETGGYYKNGNGDTPNGHVQIGWVGGLMQTYPMFLRGKKFSQKRSINNTNTLLENMQGKSGFLYGMYKNGTLYGDTFKWRDSVKQVAMTRKNADALYHLLKQLSYLKNKEKYSNHINSWEESTKRIADAFVSLWKKYGQIGQLIDVENGQIVIGSSTSAAIAPAGLVLAAHYFENPDYLKTAQAIAEYFYKNYVKYGYTTGGPGEIIQCPDSESAFAMLESFVVLYENTLNREWLDRAEEMAKICATWVVTYDFKFPKESVFGKTGVRSTGAVWASIQNKHAAPGICTASGDCLLKLFRATGNILYLDLLKDISHNIIEFVCHKERPLGSDINGYITERVNLSDWEGSWAVGHVYNTSVSWCEVAVMLTSCEIPGIYIQPDKEFLYTFDHIDAKIKKISNEGLIIEIINPTNFTASVTIMVESSTEQRKPLGWNLYPKLPKIGLKPGEVTMYRINKANQILLIDNL